MEKIVKLEEFNWVSGRDAVTIALCNTIIRKQNEIIDHLNSQDQEEEKIEYFDKGDKVRTYKSLEVSEKAYSEEPTVEDVYIEDTPEQKEEWEERFAEFFLYVTNDKNWVDGRPEWKGDVFVTLYNAILHFIEKLLDEKEKEAYFKGKEYQAKLDRECYGMSFEKLDKLNKKK